MDKVALVTGASRGIGAAIARALAEKGYKVCINYIEQQEKAETLVKELKAQGHCAICHRADVADREAVIEMVDHIEKELGYVNLLVNNAGISQQQLFQHTSFEEFHRMIDVHLFGAYNCIQAVLPNMLREHSGCIINSSSIWGSHGSSCEVAYCAAKHGLEGMSKALAQELAPSSIRVNCVAPGVIRTDMLESLGEETKQMLNDEIPMGRPGEAEEVAQAVLYLAEAGYVTGQTIQIDGGFIV